MSNIVRSTCRHVWRTLWRNHSWYLCSRIRSAQLTKWTQFLFFQRSYGWSMLTDATLAHEIGSMKDSLPSKTTMLPLSITPDTASKGLRNLAPWNVTRLEMSPPPCQSVRTFTVNSPSLSICSPPGPTYRCPFTEPLTVLKQHLTNRLDSQPILLHRSQL